MNKLIVVLALCVVAAGQRAHAFTVQHLITNVSCNGGSNGAIDLTISGGIQPYTFAWNNSATTEDVTGLSAGTYSVIITDATPSTQSATFTITQPTPLVMNATAVSPLCYNSPNTGSVIANMVQGTGPYTWTLNGPPSMTPSATDENFNWVRQGGGPGTLDNCARAVCCDKNGNVYATGEFYNTITLGNTVYTSAGNSDIFIARYTSAGALVWSRRVGGIGYDSGFGIECDTFGNIYITGRFRNTATFGTYTLTSYDVDDTFIAKYDANGNCVWVYHPVSTSSDYGWSIAVDDDQNCYITGNFIGTITYSPLAPIASPSASSIIVVKLNPAGVPVWAKVASGSPQNQGTGIALDNAGNVFITGFFTGTVNFGPYSVTSGAGDRNIFLAKYNNNGTEQWVQGTGSPSFSDYGMDVCTDNLGNAYITGYFRTTISFGAHTVVSAGADDMFLAKYNSAGTCQWAVRGGGSSIDRGHAVHCDQYNNIYVTGFYYSTAVFGSFTLTPGGFNELFVARYNSNGVLEMIKGVNGPNYEEGHCIYNDQQGNTYVSGMFGSTTSFGNITVTASGSRDLFVTRFSMTAASDTVNNLPAGSYTATVTDINGCTASGTVSITQPTPVVVAPTVTHATCYGGTGSATLSVSGGTPGYTTNWGSANPNALPAGTYPVTVTDAAGCDTTISVTVNQPTAITGTFSSTPVLCNGNCNGSLSIAPAGGSPGYSYLWSNSSVNSSVSSLCAGTYSVTVTDAAGCTAVLSQQLTEPPALTAAIAAADATCLNPCNGTVSASPAGGTPGYSYLWNTSATTNALNALCEGSYSVTITDAAGCTTSASAMVLAPDPLAATISSSDASCFNSCDGSLTAAPSGGVPGYTYLWSNSNTSNTATALCAGTYSVIITDAVGCTATLSGQITAPPALAATLSSTAAVCANSCDGTLSVSASGGEPGYSFLWSNNTTNSTATSLCAGTYSVTVTDQNGCTVVQSAAVAAPPSLIIGSILSASDTVCTGNCTDLYATVSGGTPGYFFTWQPATGLDSVSALNPTACPASSLTYSLTATDANGCTTTDSVEVIVDLCLNVAAVTENAQVLIYPNPSEGIFTLEMGQDIVTGDPSQIVLRDAAGRILEPAIYLQKERVELDLGNFADGIYFLELHTGNGSVLCRKLVKQ